MVLILIDKAFISVDIVPGLTYLGLHSSLYDILRASMSEIYIDGYHYSNSNVRPYLPKTDFTCASAALHTAYRALGLNYPETQIVRDINNDFYEGVTWTEMMSHAKSKGFSADFIEGCDFDLLWAPLYDEPYVIIVGLLAYDVSQNITHHCSPVRFVSPKNIGLTNLGAQGFEKFTKGRFTPLWGDFVHDNPFMTVRRK